jgi:hypothetical protein
MKKLVGTNNVEHVPQHWALACGLLNSLNPEVSRHAAGDGINYEVRSTINSSERHSLHWRGYHNACNEQNG